MATIELVNVTKRFSPTTPPALDGVNLTIRNGETVAVVGPSGSGKSTLLRVLAGLEGDYTGQVLYDGRDMRNAPPKDRHIGMVFQNYALYPHFLGRGNLSFFFRLRKISDAETEERIRITSEIMGIGFEELLKRKPGSLSGGQQQRVAIGRALVRNPQLFLFDEPLSNLDAKLRMQTRVEVKRLLQRFRITAVYVTHDQVEAIALGDQIAVMRAGRVEQVGPVATLLQQPANAFVAGFLGAPPMNLLTSGVVANDAIQFSGWSILLPPRVRALVYPGQALTVGVRPEAAQLARDSVAPAVSAALIHAVVEMVEPDMGRRIQWVHVKAGDHRLVAGVEFGQAVYAGDHVAIGLPDEHLHFFDAETELRIGGMR
ncbi:MAG: ABC transporter ATP-binding protein [Caldilineaceae bacterium]|nr:ABC transporter ATP-binding protein [Caldilineaceae bacterium]